MKITVCVMFDERVAQVIECIKSFLPTECEILVLNNGASIKSRQRFIDWIASNKRIRVIDESINLGSSGGRNRLIEACSADWLLFVDNDMVVNTPDWLERLQRHIANGGAEVFMPLLLDLKRLAYIDYRQISLQADRVVHEPPTVKLVNIFPSGAALVNRKLFDRLGRYDEDFHNGGEDVEFSLRAIMSGQPIRVRLIDDVELVQGEDTMEPCQQNYNLGIAQPSEQIKEKYGITLDDDWREWRRPQGSGSNSRSKGVWKFIKNLFAAGSARDDQDGGLNAIPKSCTLYMSESCNLACAGCRRSMPGVERRGQMRLEAILRLLERYPVLNDFCVAGYGEPTLCPEFTCIVDYLISRDSRVGVITNGVQVKPLLALRDGPSYISISLYGINNAQYQNNSGQGVFNQVIRNYHMLRERFERVGFSLIVSHSSAPELANTIALFDELQPDFVHMVNRLSYATEEDGEIITVQDQSLMQEIRRLVAGRDYIETLPCPIDSGSQGFACKSYERVLNLDSEGNVGGCQRQIPPDASFGNVFTDRDPFNSIRFKAQRFKMRQKIQAHPECQYCFGAWL